VHEEDESMRTGKIILVVALVLVAAVLAPSATASRPIKEPALLPDSFVDPTCGFPILIEVLDQNESSKSSIAGG
jgi:hypothetical protein